MRNFRNRKIRLIDGVSDLALATILLGVAMMVFGGSMIAGSILSMSRGYSLMGGATHLLFFAMVQGIVFVADGILLSAFCILVATTSPLAFSYKVLFGFSIFCVTIGVTALILSVAFGMNAFGSVVSLSGLAISGILTYMIRKLMISAEKMSKVQAYAIVNGLKKVG